MAKLADRSPNESASEGERKRLPLRDSLIVWGAGSIAGWLLVYLIILLLSHH
ncbi:MAG TPA: hypothetical protein VKY65_04485 [Alphaproteobacteria bacterium]|nr:hypothetical protein [Alphaproteobacteria bacterium]